MPITFDMAHSPFGACMAAAPASTDVHDVLISGAAADIAFEPVTHVRLGRLRIARRANSTALISMPGVQKPHCRP